MDKIDVTIINKFDVKNFRQWKFQMTCALKAKGSYGIVSGSEKKPASDTDGAEIKTAIEAWEKKDAGAMFTLTAGMDLSQITLAENYTSVKEIMDKLVSIYELRSERNKLLCHERFHQYKMIDTESVAQHIAKIQNLAKQIRETGDTISDAAVIIKILGTLPTKYRNFRQAWLSVSEDKQTMANLTARLLDEESCLTFVEEVDTALTVTKNLKVKKFKGPKEITCLNCHKKGHIAKFCRGKKRNKSHYELDLAGNVSAFNIIQHKPIEFPPNDKWIMDSGASAHMIFRKGYFTTFQEIGTGIQVTLGDNTCLQIHGKGTIRIQKFINNRWEDGLMDDVLYVPNLRKNLFSEGAVTNKRMKIVKINERAQIYGEGRLLAQAIRDTNNLYIMQFRTVITEINIAVENSLKVWHERLAHINIKTLKDMISKNMVDGVNLSDMNGFVCEPCMYGK
ncbi:hypothetical protein Trydic_g5631 [Trypoxylus dichotomus]